MHCYVHILKGILGNGTIGVSHKAGKLTGLLRVTALSKRRLLVAMTYTILRFCKLQFFHAMFPHVSSLLVCVVVFHFFEQWRRVSELHNYHSEIRELKSGKFFPKTDCLSDDPKSSTSRKNLKTFYLEDSMLPYRYIFESSERVIAVFDTDKVIEVKISIETVKSLEVCIGYLRIPYRINRHN